MIFNYKKISSVFLALLVTISTFSFTVEKHFCGETLVDVAYLGHADGCGMESDSSTKTMKNCCDDEVVHLEGQDELQKISIEDFEFKNIDFVNLNSFQNLDLPLLYSQKTILFEEYSPPEIIPEIQVLQQVFII